MAGATEWSQLPDMGDASLQRVQEAREGATAYLNVRRAAAAAAAAHLPRTTPNTDQLSLSRKRG